MGIKSLRPQMMIMYTNALESFFSKHQDLFIVDGRLVRTTIRALSQSIEAINLEQGFQQAPKTILALLAMSAHNVINLPEWRRHKIQVEIMDWKVSRRVSELRPEDSNQLLRIRGIVTKISILNVRLRDARMTCTKCGKEVDYGEKCPDCQSTHFVLTDKTPTSDFEQRIELREIHHDARIICRVSGDLIDSLQLGEIVDLTGVVAIDNDQENLHDRRLAFMMDVNSVRLLKHEKNGYVASFISADHSALIESLSRNPFIFPLLVNSILVRSLTNPVIRAALLLLLFSTPSAPVHIWVSRKIDDIAGYCDLPPHCIRFDETCIDKLVCRRKKNEFIAGAFVQANEGLLVIDDIDRFVSSQIVFLEILDTGHERIDAFRSVSVIFSSLVIGSSQKIDDNVRDKFTLHLEIDGEEKVTRRSTPRMQRPQSFDRWNDVHLPLADRLSGGEERISPNDLLKYIAYARQFVDPQWRAPVRARLCEIASTTTQLKRIKALAECRARAELRDHVGVSDVEEVSEMLLCCSGTNDRRHGKERVSSRQKVINDFMVEFRRLAKYKEGGCIELDEMKQIADIVQFSSRFPSFEQFLEALTTANLILQSSPKSYRPGTSPL